MRILITGGAGFIGSHLAELLISRGHAVHSLDDLSTGSMDNIRQLKASPAFVHDRVGGGSSLSPSSSTRPTPSTTLPPPSASSSSWTAPSARSRPTFTARRSCSRGEQEEEASLHRLHERGLRQERRPAVPRGRRPLARSRPTPVAGPMRARRRSMSISRWRIGKSAGFRSSSRGCLIPSGQGRPAATAWWSPRFVRQALAGEPITVYGTVASSGAFAMSRTLSGGGGADGVGGRRSARSSISATPKRSASSVSRSEFAQLTRRSPRSVWFPTKRPTRQGSRT